MEEKQKLKLGILEIKQDSEAGQSVIVCAQGECTTVTAQHFPDKHQANPLPVRLGGKEGTEEFSFGLFADSGTIVYDFYKSGGSGPYRYFALLACRFLRRSSILSAAFLMILTKPARTAKHPDAPALLRGRIPNGE